MSATLDLTAPVGAEDHVRGVSGGHQLVVYGDFECPYTAAAMRDIGRLLEEGTAFEVVFRHFPLRGIHPHAQIAAEGAEAAARQDRFWEMHDLLFRNQLRLEPDDLRRFAERLGLDLARFDADLAVRPSGIGSSGMYRVGSRAAWTGRPASSSTGAATRDHATRPPSAMCFRRIRTCRARR